MHGCCLWRLVLVAVVAALLACPARGDVDPVTGLDLRGTLEKGLKARRPEDFRFIARVVNLVDQGTLPESIVKTTFAWAREQPRHPFHYFQRALILRARRIGIDL